MCPLEDTSVGEELEWSEAPESRKDVKCVFSSMKGWFRILKIPLLYQSKGHIDNVIFTFAALHNILLEWDSLSTSWEADMDWSGDDGQFDE